MVVLLMGYGSMYSYLQGFPGDSAVKNPPAMQETWFQSLGGQDPLEKGMANHSSILATLKQAIQLTLLGGLSLLTYKEFRLQRSFSQLATCFVVFCGIQGHLKGVR